MPFADPCCGNLELQGGKLSKEDVFEIRNSTGHFNVLFPVRVDFVMGRLRPAQRCLRMVESDATSGPRYEDLCDYDVAAQRVPTDEDTFVRLFPEPDERRTPKHVVVKGNSKVEFLAARTKNIMNAQGQWSDSFEEHPWLKVRIDGNVGWVRAAEDVIALGLPQFG